MTHCLKFFSIRLSSYPQYCFPQITTLRLVPGCGPIHRISPQFIPLPLLPFLDPYIGLRPPYFNSVNVAAALYTEILYEVYMIWLNSKSQNCTLDTGYKKLSTRIVLHFMGLCVYACVRRNSILFMHSVINIVTAWFRIFFGLLTVIHQVTKFCVGLDLRVPSPWSGKPASSTISWASWMKFTPVKSVSLQSVLVVSFTSNRCCGFCSRLYMQWMDWSGLWWRASDFNLLC